MSEDEGKEKKEAASIQELFVKNGLYIGSRIKVKHMEKFIYRLRPDGVYLIDISKTIERLNIAARFISYFKPEDVVVVSTHVYGITPVKKFCEYTRCIPIVEHFEPGTFTNPSLRGYLEPELVLVSDPRYDNQAVIEAKIARIPVIGMCSTDNMIANIDLVIPMNNRGRLALPYAFWYLAQRVLIERDELTPELSEKLKPEEFLQIRSPQVKA
ncbi:MAG: 30S ribosomal protein S2 [Thaumarchaeota archaeon]|nr:MAG: 30S ribosomal protein S2 [Nitrososphaerota archaeon]RLG05394.1 MAG: 30S ribosomal protein S2 [Nitrososphaerota archaeon]HDD42259.1 30S ribosomal protein S2 [Nitrososphaeria archaeon]